MLDFARQVKLKKKGIDLKVTQNQPISKLVNVLSSFEN